MKKQNWLLVVAVMIAMMVRGHGLVVLILIRYVVTGLERRRPKTVLQNLVQIPVVMARFSATPFMMRNVLEN